MLSRVQWYVSGGLLVALLAALGFAGLMHAQRDTARSALKAARVEVEVARSDARTASAAAEKCAADFADQDARCRRALDAASAGTDRARRALRACKSDDAVAARLAEVTK